MPCNNSLVFVKLIVWISFFLFSVWIVPFSKNKKFLLFFSNFVYEIG